MKIKNIIQKLIVRNKKKTYPNEYYLKHDCCLISYQTPLLAHCFILCHQAHDKTITEDQLIIFAQQEAHRLSLQYTQQPNNFILTISGQNIRKRDNWHLHIFIIENRLQKAYAYQIVAVKNFMLAVFK